MSVENTASSNFLLHAAVFRCLVISSLAELLSCFEAFTKYPSSPALLLSRSLSEFSQLFHLFMWLRGNWLCCVEILSCPTFYEPCVKFLLIESCSLLSSLPIPVKPEICFLITFSPSITCFSHCVDIFKYDKLWHDPSDEPYLFMNHCLFTTVTFPLWADWCFSSALFL